MRVRAAALLVCAALGAPEAYAQEAQAPAVQSAAPLAQVLDEIAAEFEVDFVYEEDVVAHLSAAPVRGASSAYDALDHALAGTGLTFRFTSDRAFTIEPFAELREEADLFLNWISVSQSDPNSYEWYGRQLLREVLAALRREERLTNIPADFRLYFWMAEDGSIARLTIEGLDGDDLRAAASAALGALRLEDLPPYDMPQPIGLSIRAQ